MINPISGGMPSAGMQQMQQQNSMTAAQKTSASEIIEKYAAGDFGKAEFEAMGKEFNDAGIRPNSELKAMVETAGIDVSAFLPEAGGKTQPPPPPPPSQGQGQGGIDSTNLQTLKDILESYDLENLTYDGQSQLMDELTAAGFLQQQGLIVNINA